MSFKSFIHTYRYIKHNKKLFKQSGLKKGIILLEIFDHKPSVIPNSYISNSLSKKYKSSIYAYQPTFRTIKQKIFFFLKNILNPLGIINIYKSFGVEKFIFPKNIISQKENNLIFKKIYTKIKKKEDILSITIDHILLGDLIYDDYLRTLNLVTIDLKSEEFKNFLYKSIQLYFFWKKFFEKNDIKSVVISHNVYLLGLLSRLAIGREMPVYTTGMTNIQFLSKKNERKNSHYENYKKIFKKIDSRLKIKLLNYAKKNLEERFSGKKDIKILLDRHTDRKIYSVKKSNKTILEKNNKIKVLVAAHQFNDAVHAYGNFFFSDFYEWMDFLGKCTYKTNYDWYIKFHPAEFESNLKHINYFKEKYPSFKVLPADVTNTDLIKEKINVVLTVYGSIGYEYPLFNIPVINATNNGAHKSFNFNIYPRNIKHYRSILLNLKKVKPVKIKKEKIYIYYLMRHLMEYNLLDNFKKILTEQKSKYYTEEVYNVFLKQFNRKKNKEIIKIYDNFLKSRKFRIFAENLTKKSKLIFFN
jgi:hypothetical protein